MFNRLKQIRSAAELLSPDEVRRRTERPITIGLAASGSQGYAELEDFLLPAEVPHHERVRSMERIFREGDPGAPETFDLVIYRSDVPAPEGAFVYYPEDPQRTIDDIVERIDYDELALPLARQFPGFRRPVVDQIVHKVSRENAMFALATSLPNFVMFLPVPWAIGEFASDTAFISMNQVRMAFMIAAACGRPVGLSEQKIEVGSIAAGAFGWRAIARELAGKIPFGGGMIPKGAIAYAGTYVLGKGMAHFSGADSKLTRRQRRALYNEAYERGRSVSAALRKELA